VRNSINKEYDKTFAALAFVEVFYKGLYARQNAFGTAQECRVSLLAGLMGHFFNCLDAGSTWKGIARISSAHNRIVQQRIQ
jgi:hypothetical protein